MTTASQRAAWAVQNLKNAEEKYTEGKANIEYLVKAEEILIDATAEAHYESAEGHKYRAQQRNKS